MRKIFTLFAAMLLAVAVNADPSVISVSAGANTLSAAIADEGTHDGDILELANGDFTESSSFSVKKSLTIRAAAGATPVIKQAAEAYMSIKNNAKLLFKGLKFDGNNTATYCIYATETSQNNAIVIRLEDCEFTGFIKNVISSTESGHADSLIINNCYFHDNNGRASVYFPVSNSSTTGQQTTKGVRVTNSTFANNTNTSYSTGVIDVRSIGNNLVDSIEVTVDHCTFYKNTTPNFDYADVKVYKSSKVVISNCIFYGPSSTYDGRATHLYAGTIKNCLTINYVHDAAGHRDDGATFKDTLLNRDPLFVDAANGNFMLGAGSPALTAGTDGKAIGDPFWNTRTLYLKPGVWNADGDKFAIWCFGSGSHTSQWSGFMTQVGESDIYTTNIPAGFPTITFARIAGNAASPNWNDKHNQTANQTIDDALDMCKITAWGESGKDSPCEWFKYGIALYGDMNSWSKSADLLAEDGDDYKITINLAAGEYFFKLIDHGDYRANGWWFKRDATTATGISADGTNMKIVADKDGDYVITWTRVTGTLSVTFPSETALDNTVAGEKAVKVLRNGQLFIEKDGKTYNVLGTVVK